MSILNDDQNKTDGTPQNTGGPALKLTKEQIIALLSQLVDGDNLDAVLNNNEGEKQSESGVVDESSPTPQAPSKAGKKILFQSDDFDSNAKKTEPDASAFFSEPEEKSELLSDDDFLSDLNPEEKGESLGGIFSTAAKIKTTDFGEKYIVREKEFFESELRPLPDLAFIDTKHTPLLESSTSDRIDFKNDSIENKAVDKGLLWSFDGKSALSENENIMVSEEEIPADDSAPSKKSAKKAKNPKNKAESPDSEKKPRVAKKTADIIRIAVLCVALVAILVSSGFLIREWKLSKDNDELEIEAENLIVPEEETVPAKKNDAIAKEKNDTAKKTNEQKWAEIKKQFPSVVFPPNLQLKFAKLYATNQDFVGYLTAKGANLSLPIVQTGNDQDYLEQNFYKQKTKYGCPFVTCLNHIDTLDQNTVIFGHHMNNGTIFGALDNYKTIDGFKKAPLIEFDTLTKNYKFKVIAAFLTNAEPESDNGYVFNYYFTNCPSKENFSAYLSELSQRSLYDTGVDVSPLDKLLTLSTCSHEWGDARMVVVARMLRPGESETVDVEKAVKNAQVRYPQAYYDKKKQTNPFKTATRWYVD